MREFFFGNEPIRWIQELFGLGHPLPFRVFSLLGDTWGMLLVAGLALWIFGRRPFHAVVGIVVVGAATKVVLSEVFYQTRPEGPGIVVYEHLEVSSFPSGHVFEGVAPWALLWALGCVRFWVPAAVAVLVSLGRLYLGTHYLGDVVAGVLFAAALVWIYVRVWPRAYAWLSRRGWSFFVTGAVLAIAGAGGWLALAGGSPRRYEVVGMLAGAALALVLEARLVRYRPGEASAARAALRVAVGTAGIAAFLLWDRSQAEQALLLGTWTAGLATLWAAAGAPALFRALGLAPGGDGRDADTTTGRRRG